MDEELNQSFPVDWEDDNYVTRREFLKFGTVTSGALAVGSAGLLILKQAKAAPQVVEPMRIGFVGDVAPSTSLPFNFPGPKDLALLICQPDGAYVAYSRRCTHLSCPVVYQPGEQRLFCPCHNGAFSIEDGSVLQGPPPHKLPQISIEIRGTEIWATGMMSGETEHGA